MASHKKNRLVVTSDLPQIPNKVYFTIGEVSYLCSLEPHVLRYWEQEFGILRPVKRRGNRRYYQAKDIEVVRKIRELLYLQGFTIEGARQRLSEQAKASRKQAVSATSDHRQPIEAVIDELEHLLVELEE